jgi:UDP-N-acetylmuramoyl-tripeptide--D-alanyl-D-alanine ligase
MTIIAKLKRRFYFVGAEYFRVFANISLKKWQPRVIAVTGSVGKTTMLELIETQLKRQAHYSHNANSAYGIAFDILGLRGVTGSKWKWLGLIVAAPMRAMHYQHHEKFYVVEIDGERPHETGYIAKWLRPEVTVWVSLGRSHAVFYEQAVARGEFADVDEAIAHEFSMLPKYTKKLVLIDGENETMRKVTEGIKAKVVALSKSKIAEYEVYPDRSEFMIAKKQFKFQQPMPRDIGIQLVMVVELMKYLGQTVNYDLQDFVMPPGRSNFLYGRNGVKIVDSSYNAHLISMASVLEMVRAMQTQHKWLVIGDIIDQGKLEGEEHQKLAKLILDAKPKQVVLVGRRTAEYTYPLLKGKLAVESFRKPQQALKYLEKSLTGKETVIFKGSQYLEWIVEKLLADPGDAVLLPRQDKAHKKRRAGWGLE